MSMTDPIADMLTRIRNALLAKHETLGMPASKTKLKIAEILKAEGYITDFERKDEGYQGTLSIDLKWFRGAPAIEGIKRVSRPGQRQYAKCDEIPKVQDGLGIMIVSTSHGMMTDRAARKKGVGGELVCSVW
ncbi:MAG: 30S ribosomal protein S8 [Nannocystaceae bacterium]|nr:30S ribosomal protein S8 [Nannocystaceae bacterium]